MAEKLVCECGRVCGNKPGLIAHGKRCPAHRRAVENPVYVPPPERREPEAVEALLPPAEELREHDDPAALGAQLSDALGDDLPPDPVVLAASKKKPAGITIQPPKPGDKKADGPPVNPREELDALSKRLGADFFRAGTENRFRWCRESDEGSPRHTFSRLYADQRVLVDVYADRTKTAEVEVQRKIAQIERHNELEPGDRWGYLAFIRSEGIPSLEDCRSALALMCVPLPPKPAALRVA